MPLVSLVLSVICFLAIVWYYPGLTALFAGLLVLSWLLFRLFVRQNLPVIRP